MQPNLQFELTHDTIAKQVFDKASVEARTRRKVEKFIRERYERKAKLTEDDLDYIRPYWPQVNISADAQNYLEKGQRGLYRAKKRRQIITASVILTLSLALGIAFYQNIQVNRQKEIAEMTALALEYKSFDETQAFKYAQAACEKSQNQDMLAIKTRKGIINTQHLFYQSTFGNHQAKLSKVLFTSDKQYLISSDYKGILLKQSVSNASIVFNISHSDAIEDIRLSHDGKKLAVACRDKHLYLYNVDDGKLLHKFSPQTTAVSQAVFSVDDQFLISANTAGTIIIWDLNDYGQLRSSSHHNADINSLTISPDGQWLMSSGANGILSLWDWQSERLPRRIKLLNSRILTSFFHPDSKSYFTVSFDSPISQWDLNTDSILTQFPSNEIRLSSLCISPNAQFLLAGLANGSSQIWDLDKQKLAYTLKGQRESIGAVAFSNDSEWVVSGGTVVHLWNLDHMIPQVVLEKRSSFFSQTTFSGAKNIALRTQNNKLQLWQLSVDNEPILSEKQFDSLSSRITSIQLLDNSLISASKDGEIVIWDIEKADVKSRFKAAEKEISLLNINDLGNQLALISNYHDLLIWDIDNQVIIDSASLEQEIGAMDIAPSGERLIAGGSEGALYYYNQDGDSIINLHPNNRLEIRQVCFDSSGERFIVSTGSDIVEMNLKGDTLSQYENPIQNGIRFLKYDGDYIWAGTNRGDIMKWDRQTGFLLFTLAEEIKEGRISVIDNIQLANSQSYIYAQFNDGSIKRFPNPLK